MNILRNQFSVPLIFRLMLPSTRRQSCGPISRGTALNIPTWTKPGLYGAGIGAIALAIIGFSWGGWVTGATSAKAAASETSSGIATALVPYCIEKSKSDPAAAQVLTDVKAASGYNKRGIVEKAGWATPLGTDTPNSALAALCSEELSKTL